MKYYQHGKTPGTFHAQQGKYDDPVMALALALDGVIKFGNFDPLEDSNVAGILTNVGANYHYNEDTKIINRVLTTENDIRRDDLLPGPALVNIRGDKDSDIFGEGLNEDLISFLLGTTGDITNVRRSSMSTGRMFQQIKNGQKVL